MNNINNSLFHVLDTKELTDFSKLSFRHGAKVNLGDHFYFFGSSTVADKKDLFSCFFSTILPSVVNVGRMRFRIHPYFPNSIRCFSCRRYDHKADLIVAHLGARSAEVATNTRSAPLVF